MVFYPYLRNNGYLLYKDMIHPYPPVLTLGLSIFYKVFGYRLEVLKILTWLIVLVNDVLIYAVTYRLTKKIKPSIAALFLYVLIQPFLEGNQLWFDLAIVPFVLTGIYFLSGEKSKRNLFISGFLFGIAAFIKQTVGIFLIVIPVYLLFKRIGFRKVTFFLLGPMIIFLTLIARLITEDALLGFFEWTLINPLLYWGSFPGYVQMAINKREILILGILSLPALLLLKRAKEKVTKEGNALFLLISLLISIVLVYPRFSFFHLQLFLALIGIIFGYVIAQVKINKILIAAYFALIILFITVPNFNLEWQKETRFWSKSDLELAKLISEKTKDSQKVYFLGPPSSLYVFSEKLPPKVWSDNYGWYYASSLLEKKIISSWQKDSARYIVWQDPGNGNWYDLGVYQPPFITQWIRENYTRKEEISLNIWLWEKK